MEKDNEYYMGLREGKLKARHFHSLTQISETYSHKGYSFIKGFYDAFNDYWENKLMGEF